MAIRKVFTDDGIRRPLPEVGFSWLVTDVLTEENTDIIIGLIDRIDLPFWLRWAKPILKKALDAALPGILVDVIEDVLIKRGWVMPAQAEILRHDNPFN